MDIEAIGREAVDCGYHVYKELGPGLLESVYEVVLAQRLVKRRLRVERQKPITFTLHDTTFTDAFRIDILVENVLLIEVKSLEQMHAIHNKQLLTYLRLMKLPLGFLMNFGAPTFKEGIRRVINDYWPDHPARSA